MPVFLALLGIGAVVGYFVASGKTSGQQSSAPNIWPPTTSFLNGLASQTSVYVTNATGSAAPARQISDFVNQSVQAYLLQLPAGAAPSLVDYQAWYWSQYVETLQQTGLAPGYAQSSGGSSSSNPYGLG